MKNFGRGARKPRIENDGTKPISFPGLDRWRAKGPAFRGADTPVWRAGTPPGTRPSRPEMKITKRSQFPLRFWTVGGGEQEAGKESGLMSD
jgi:hypothetical protein